jgi:hypothetical protein
MVGGRGLILAVRAEAEVNDSCHANDLFGSSALVRELGLLMVISVTICF